MTWTTIALVVACLLVFDGLFGLFFAEDLQPLVRQIFPGADVRVLAAAEIVAGVAAAAFVLLSTG